MDNLKFKRVFTLVLLLMLQLLIQNLIIKYILLTPEATTKEAVASLRFELRFKTLIDHQSWLPGSVRQPTRQLQVVIDARPRPLLQIPAQHPHRAVYMALTLIRVPCLIWGCVGDVFSVGSGLWKYSF